MLEVVPITDSVGTLHAFRSAILEQRGISSRGHRWKDLLSGCIVLGLNSNASLVSNLISRLNEFRTIQESGFGSIEFYI